jgi:hypothetical protein
MAQLLCIALRRCLKPEYIEVLTPYEFVRLFVLAINGDDNLVGFRNELERMVLDGFFDSPAMFVEAMCSLGVVYECNGETKWKSVEEVNFLSSKPVYYDGRWVSVPADLDRFYTKLVWGTEMSLDQTILKIVQDKMRAIFDDEVVDVLEALIESIKIDRPEYIFDEACLGALRLNIQRSVLRRLILGGH